ncbi:MAG: hypothetical protein JW832_04750 [Deltaproteobacteria bacterium]|nr:hypothetical protein [Deltaproteobacteria bacterium]
MNFEKFTIHKIHTTKAKLLTDPDIRNVINLEMLLEYELAASSRYRRYVSVVLFKGVGNGTSHLKDMLSDNIRSCDASFSYGNYLAVLMGETDDQGTAIALERYKRNLSGRNFDICFASVTYPKDGITVDDLSRILLGRIEDPTCAQSLH